MMNAFLLSDTNASFVLCYIRLVLSLSLFTWLAVKPNGQFFDCVIYDCYSGGIAIYYVLPVLGIMSCYHSMMGHVYVFNSTVVTPVVTVEP